MIPPLYQLSYSGLYFLLRFRVKSRAEGRNRTGDLLLTMELLYHLSYFGLSDNTYQLTIKRPKTPKIKEYTYAI